MRAVTACLFVPREYVAQASCELVTKQNAYLFRPGLLTTVSMRLCSISDLVKGHSSFNMSFFHKDIVRTKALSFYIRIIRFVINYSVYKKCLFQANVYFANIFCLRERYRLNAIIILSLSYKVHKYNIN